MQAQTPAQKIILSPLTRASLSPYRYGFHEAKTTWETLQCCNRVLKAYLHNPFGSDDRYNRELRDRELKYLANVYRQTEGTVYHPALKNSFDMRMANNRNINICNKALGIIAEMGVNYHDKYSDKQYAEILEHMMHDILNQTRDHAFKEKDVQILVAVTMREILKDFNSEERITDIIKEKVQLKIRELFPKAPNYDSRTQGLLSVMKGEFVFCLGLFVMETAFAAISPELAFSLTASSGMASFEISIALVIITLSCVTALMEGSWKQLASYGDENGPKTLREAWNNILQHTREGWNKAVDSDKSLHPIVDGLLNAAFVVTSWSWLARKYGVTSHAILYSVLDGYLSAKASWVTGKDPKTAARDFLVACLSGIARGSLKNILKTTAYGPDYTALKGFHEAVITYVNLVFGYVVNIFLTQLLSGHAKPKTE